MKRKIASTLTMAVIMVTALTLNSCRKDALDKDTTPAQDNAQAEETYNDVFNMADEAATTGDVSYKNSDESGLLSGCATVTRDTVSMPHTVTIDFGNGGCTGNDGRTRKGKILVSYDGPYRALGTTIVITFDNYFVNDNQILGTKTVHNDGVNGNGNLSYSITVSGQVIKANNGGTVTWASSRTREWTEGESTLSLADDVYKVSGTASGTSANGNTFTATITSPLVRKLAPGCRRHFVEGTMEVEVTGKPTRYIDFGDGSCDGQITVTINGNTYDITLPW
jgi:hypothetical protein